MLNAALCILSSGAVRRGGGGGWGGFRAMGGLSDARPMKGGSIKRLESEQCVVKLGAA